MDHARIENDNVVFPSHFGHNDDLVYPIELLEAVSNLGQGAYKLQEALMFYKITKDAPEWRWTTPEAVAGADLTGWEFYYYESNYEDSNWSNVWLTREIRLIKDPNKHGGYEFVDLDGEAESWVLDYDQAILLVKLTNEEFADRVAQNALSRQQAAIYEQQRLERHAAEATRKSSDPLEEWERELLALNDPA